MTEQQDGDLVEYRSFDLSLRKIQREISRSHCIQSVKSLRDKAEAARVYVRNARLGLAIQNRAAEIRLRAERRVGQLLRRLNLRGGDRKSNRHDDCLKLEDLGISQNQSTRWQRIARIEERDFQACVDAITAEDRELTANLVIARTERKASKRSERRQTNCSVRRARQPADLSSQVEEAVEHQKLLAAMLRPVLDSELVPLKHAERRHLCRLIADIRRILENVQSALDDDRGPLR